MTQAEKYRLIESPCTLNGKPAAICGAAMPWAMVRTIENSPRLCGEFAWPTVARIVANGGNFVI